MPSGPRGGDTQPAPGSPSNKCTITASHAHTKVPSQGNGLLNPAPRSHSVPVAGPAPPNASQPPKIWVSCILSPQGELFFREFVQLL